LVAFSIACEACVLILRVTKAVIFVAALLPLALFVNDYLSHELARPWQMLIGKSARWSIRCWTLMLCLAPAAALFRFDSLRDFRRMIGLFGAFYAAVHVFAWARQYGYDWSFLGMEITSARP